MAKRKRKKRVRLNACGKLRRHRPYTRYGDRIAALGTQREIGREMGVVQQSVSKKLQGESAITLAELKKLSKHYDLPLAYFFEKGPPDPELSSALAHARTERGPFRNLLVAACGLRPSDQEKLLAIAETLTR
ncbi:MAG: helix-turn-helix domain-containing protein [Planctomycetota bacterium]|jgi:transcriptional regulator with XRE-family HTH domain